MYELEARIYFDGAIAVDIADAADQPDGSTELLSIEEASEHTEQESNDSYLGIETELETGTDSSYSSDSIDPIEQLVAGISGDFDFASSYIINQTPETNNPSVLLISSLIENAEEITESASDSTIVIQCKEGMTLNFILEEIRTELDGAEASSIAIVTEDADASFYLTPQNQISENSLSSNADLQNFMQELSSELSNDGTIDIISQDTVDNDIDYQDYLEHLTGKTVSIADTDDIDITSKYFVSSVQNTELNIQSSEVVFINSSVMNAENIIDDLPDNVNIVYLKAGEDGIQEITDYLANKTDIDTMRIISHGNEGYFVLNGEVIDGEYVTNHADLIAEWGDSLSEDGDIMLYGCNLAATTKGQDLVQHIADLTGADVAASTDTTGVSGDWNLEYSIGIIEAGVITDVGYEHNLTNYLVSNTHGSTDIKNSFGWALTEANTSIGADEITFDLSLDSREIIIDNTLNITDDITISGNGVDETLIREAGNNAVFNIDDEDAGTQLSVTIENISIGDENSTGNPINNNEYLIINNSNIGGFGYVSNYESDWLTNSTHSNSSLEISALHADEVVTLLNAGTAVTLLYDNNIAVVSDISVNNINGDGGDFTLQAGHTVLINADITTDNGDLTITGQEVLLSGNLDVSSAVAKGGKIIVMGDNIIVRDGAHLNASGATGGGEIYVGGGWQGKDPEIYQATNVLIEAGALLEANAIDTGDGGTVVAWSNVSNPSSVTRAYGTFEANGGENGGDGGRIETSGHWLDTHGSQGSAAAQNGDAGIWLFDPYNVTITSAEANGTWSGANPDVWTPNASGSTILNTDITSKLSSGTDVTITTDGAGGEAGNITVNSTIAIASSRTLSLLADGAVTIGADITGSGGRLVLESGKSGATGKAVTINNQIRLSRGRLKITSTGGAQSNAEIDAYGLLELYGTGAFNINSTSGSSDFDHFIANVDGSIDLYENCDFFYIDAAGVTCTGDVTLRVVRNFTINGPINITGTGDLALKVGTGSYISVQDSISLANGSLSFVTESGSSTYTISDSITSLGGGLSFDQPVTLSGTPSISCNGTLEFADTLTPAASSNITLTANAFTFSGNVVGDGTQQITLSPYSVDKDIDLGSAGSGNIIFTQAELDRFQNFTDITIGRTGGTGTTTIVSNSSVAASGTFTLMNDTIIASAGTLTNTSGDITLNGNTLTLSDTITANSGNGTITLQQLTASNALSINNSTVSQLSCAKLIVGRSDGGALTIADDITTSAIVHLKSSSTVTATDGWFNVANLAVTAGGAVNITDTNNDVDVFAVSAAGQTVTFQDTDGVDLGTVDGINGITATTFNLTTVGAITDSQASTISGITTIAAGSGNNITLDHVSNNFSSVGITTGNNVALVDSGALRLNASTISGTLNVTTGGALTDSGALAVTGTTTLAAGSSNDITLDHDSNNFSSMNITSGNDVTIVDADELTITDITNTLGGKLDLTAGGTGITINHTAITTTTTQDYNSAVTLGANTVLTTTDSNITFDNTINGAKTLSLQAGGGDITVTGVIGGTTGVSSINFDGAAININDIGDSDTVGVSGNTDINGTTTITFAGTTYNASAQNYTTASGLNFDMTAGATTTFTSNDNNITFNVGDIQLSNGSNLVINAGTGTVTALKIDGTSSEDVSITGGTITIGAVGTQTTNGINDLTINNTTDSTLGGNIEINGTLTKQGDALFQTTTRDISAAAISVTAGTFGAASSPSGDWDFSGAVTISSGATLNATAGSFTVGGNWINEGTFNHKDGTVTFNGISTVNTGGTGLGKDFSSVTLNGTSVTLSENHMTVKNTLTLSTGLLTLGAKNLIISNSAAGAISRTNGIVVTNSTGTLRRAVTTTGTYLFPVGSGSGAYSPTSLVFTSGTGNVDVRVINTADPNLPASVTTDYINRYWAITSDTTFSATVTCTYLPGDIIGTGTLYGYKYSTDTKTWTKGNVAASNSFSITVTSFSTFTAVAELPASDNGGAAFNDGTDTKTKTNWRTTTDMPMFGDNGGLGDIGITLGGESDGIGGENSSSNIIISTTTSETFATALAADVSDTTITNANNVTGAATTATAAASTSTAAATTAADSAANQCQCDGRGTCSYCRAKSAENRGLFSGGKPESLSISGKANAAGVLIGGAAAAVGIGAVMGPQMKKMLKKMLKNGKGASSKKIAAAGAAETEVPDWEPTPGEEIKGDSFFKKAKSDTYFGNF